LISYFVAREKSVVQIIEDLEGEIVRESLKGVVFDVDDEEDQEAILRVLEYYSTPSQWESFKKENGLET
jgi:hypothetical protein